MNDEAKVPCLKIDRGRYFYQRRVPQRSQANLRIKRWQIPELYLDRLRDAYSVGFGAGREPPIDPDKKDEYDFIKRKLERKISELSPDLNTISTVSERYYAFNSIRPATRAKYRRELSRLISITGDVPIKHVRAEHLRQLRNQLIGQIKPSGI